MAMSDKPPLELATWQHYQLDFTRHIRDPAQHPRPRGVDRRGMQTYSALLFNNIEAVVSACFPVLSGLLGKRKWQRLLRAFFATHRCSTPFFRQVPDEFLQFLQQEWQAEPAYPDFMLELAHYEWVELALSTSSLDQHIAAYLPDGDLLDAIPVLNPVMANLAYRYPVHEISRTYQPATAPNQAVHLLVYRDANDDIHFSLQNAVSARLIEFLTPAQLTGRAALHQLAVEICHADPDALLAFGHDLLRQLHTQGCILGSRMIA